MGIGNRSLRIQSNESLHAKIFVEFVALILRNKMHFLLKEQMKRNVKRANYMNARAAANEISQTLSDLEKKEETK